MVRRSTRVGPVARGRPARRPRLVALVAVVALGAGAVACTSSPSDDADPPAPRRRSTTTAPSADAAAAVPSTLAVTSTTVAPFDLRRADLGASTYRVLCPGGEVELQPMTPAPGIDDRPVVLDPFEPQFLDLTGDGRPEAVVEVGCRVADEWSDGVRSVIVLGAEGGAVVQMGQPLDGADPTVVGASLAVGRQASVSTDDAGRSSSVVYEPYSFDGAAWVSGSDGSAVQPSDPVTVDGIGALVVGAPFGEVAVSTGQPVEASDPGGSGGTCVDVRLPAGPEGIDGLGGDGVLRAVRVANPSVRTDEGLGVGSTEAEVQAAHPDEVTVVPFAGGHRLVVHPADLPDRVLAFDTDGTTVTAYAVGEAGWADGAPGCP